MDISLPLRTRASVLAIVVCIVGLGASSAAAAGQPSPTILVKFAPQANAAAIVASAGDTHLSSTAGGVDVIKVHAGSSVDQQIARYQRHAGVVYAEENATATAAGLAAPNDPSYATQWGLSKISALAAWNVFPATFSLLSAPAIAIIDTGSDTSHSDLVGRLDLADSANCVNSTNACVTGGAADDNGHGTHVAGIAGAATNNGVGVAGVDYESSLIPIKVLDSSGSGSYAAIANGIAWAAQHGARVINMSLGGASYSQTLCDAIASAVSRGVLVVAAAGNSATSTAFYPAGCPGVVGVAATDANDAAATFSNSGAPNVFVSAPGVSIYSTYKGNSYATLSGTSMAAPFVTGLAGLLFAQSPTRTPAAVRQILAATSDKVGSGAYGGDPYGTCATCTWNGVFGYGRINASRALGAASPPPPPPAPAPTPPTSGTTTFAIAAGADDADVSTNSMGAGGAYPPASTPTVSAGGTSFGVRRGGPVYGGYEVRTALLRFNTSSLPAGATVTSATLQLQVLQATSADGRRLVAEWANGTAWPVGTAAFTATPSNTASVGAPISTLVPNASNSLPLQNLASISRTGYTTLRLHVDGGQPSGENLVFFRAAESGATVAARLVVSWTA